MPYPFVVKPRRLPDAFEMDGGEAAQSQAALLLYLDALLHRDKYMDEQFSTKDRWLELDDIAPSDDLKTLEIPDHLINLRKYVATRYSLKFIHERLEKDEGADARWVATHEPPKNIQLVAKLQARLAKEFFEKPATDEDLVMPKLLVVSLYYPDLLVRVAAAVLCFKTFVEEDHYRFGAILTEGVASKDVLVRDVAATALARLAPDHPVLRPLMPGPGGKGEGESAHTSAIIHGTWARGQSWWQPGGDFHNYILNKVDSSVYAGTDRFEWSGGYSNSARCLGAQDLCDWMQRKGLSSPDFFTHSHGGSVVMLANHTLNIGRMVLLSCPVHRHKYWPNFRRVKKIVSVRVHWDLVILADHGGQRFRDPQIVENVLPLWFNHSISHDPDTWRRYNVPSMI